MSTHLCPNCGATKDFPTSIRAGKICSCGGIMSPYLLKRGRTDAQRRSRSQERRAAKAYKVRQQAGSGAPDHCKGDGRARGERRVECKETTAKSYTLKLAELMKLEAEARGDEMPIFQIEFQGVHPFKRYEVLPAGSLQELIAEVEELKRRLAE